MLKKERQASRLATNCKYLAQSSEVVYDCVCAERNGRAASGLSKSSRPTLNVRDRRRPRQINKPTAELTPQVTSESCCSASQRIPSKPPSNTVHRIVRSRDYMPSLDRTQDGSRACAVCIL